ncbi:MAG: twin-arginine translocation signal domain-containing protein [Kofleriaceae bacterium]|nr:twin-arginine translocation signal domain-containing protein [Kofleriaceae bacterium]
MGITRRRVLQGLGAAAGAVALGCGDDEGAAPDAAAPDAGFAPDARIEVDGAPVTACTATSPLGAAELLADIETIVVLCMENRSFDHYLGSLRLAEGRLDVDGLTGAETNPDPDGAPVAVHRLDDFTPDDPPHGWDPCHDQWNDGGNDGFVRAHAGASQADVMGYHVRDQLPVTYALADAAAICQRWFCGCLGPTWPNRFYLHGATSNGVKSNLPALGFRSVFAQLDDAGVANLNYYSDVAWATGGYGKLTGLATIERFFEDAGAGNLPPFAIVDPAFFGGGANDDHPDHDVRLGQALIASVAAAIGGSPQWDRCLFVVTYDEHGGFFDHVPPPEAADDDPDFRRLGFRVPSLVIGPTVRRGCAIDATLEHASVASTLAVRHGLAPLTARAAAAADLSACIDPRRLGDPLPPPVLPPVEVSLREVARRQALARRRPLATHRELAAALDARPAPAALDRRGDTDAVVRRTLAWGERLGAVRLRD